MMAGTYRSFITAAFLALLAGFLILPGDVSAEIYTPPGYADGQNLGETNWGLDVGFKSVAEDYYLLLTPKVRFKVWKLSMGFELPVEVLGYDADPQGNNPVGSVREGYYDEIEDLSRIITFIRYGQHNYYNPDDDFNWSLFLGRMSDGYIGHRTIVHRYVTTYDPSVYRMGMMADINNRWGGIEVFQSDVFRKEVVGGRAYIRPLHWFTGIRNLLVADYDAPAYRDHVAVSSGAQRDPARNGGVFYQEKLPQPGEGGRLEQHLHNTLEDDYAKQKQGDVKFEEVEDPSTGDVQVRAIPVPPEDRQTDSPGLPEKTEDQAAPDIVESKTQDRPEKEQPEDIEKLDEQKESPADVAKTGEKPAQQKEEEDVPSSPWDSGFWSRWAIGYSVVKDYNAPLTLEKDGSGNLVIDPETGLARTAKGENVVVHGVDMEFRLSPVDWIDLTPYVDHNEVRDLESSEGTHVGVTTEFKLTDTLKFFFRPEYRDMSSNYLPVYFDSFYAVERNRYNTGNASNTTGTGYTKLEYLKGLPRHGPRVRGLYTEFMFEWVQYFVMEFSYEDYTGDNNSRVFLGVYVPTLFGFFMNGYYTKKNFDKFSEAFDVDDRSLIAGEIGYELFGGFYVKVTSYRTWQYDDRTSSYTPQDETVYGFGFSSAL